MYKLKRNGHEWSCEIIKSAHTSLGANIYLLDRVVSGSLADRYIVGVRIRDTTKEYKSFCSFKLALTYYLDMLCCYA